MPLPADADVFLILGRIRARAKWRSNGGPKNDPASVVWDDQDQVEPTEAEYLAGHNDIAAEDARVEAVRRRIKGEVNAIAGTSTRALTADQLKSLVEAAVFGLGGIGKDDTVKPIDEWNIRGDLNPL